MNVEDELRLAGANNWKGYFVTLTFHMGTRVKLWKAACKLAGDQHPSRRQRARPVIAEVGEFLRRLRSRNKRIRDGHLRYLAVVEYHQSGDPHVHLVLTGTITSKTIRRARWTGGFLHVRRIPIERSTDVAAYVSKYISKSADSVVTHSKLYGKNIYRPDTVKGERQSKYDEDLLEAPVPINGGGLPKANTEGAGAATSPPLTQGEPPFFDYDPDFWQDISLLRIMHQRSYSLECPKTPVQLEIALLQEPGAATSTTPKRSPESKVAPPAASAQSRTMASKKSRAVKTGTQESTVRETD